jgi:acetylglutamate kinase
MRLLVKLSGKVLDEPDLLAEQCRQIALLAAREHQLLLVHGAGKQLTELCGRLDIPVVQHQGRRVTDQATLEAAKMVFSAVNRTLTAALLASGVRAVGLTGYDGGLTRCRRRGPIPVKSKGTQRDETRLIDFGLVAEIEEVDAAILEGLWEMRMLPVVCSLCADPGGQVLNINADTLAAELALGARVDRLIAVSDVQGVYFDRNDPCTRIPKMTAKEATDLVRDGRVAEGMVPKLDAAVKLLERGVPSFQLVGPDNDALLRGLEGEAGTVIIGG